MNLHNLLLAPVVVALVAPAVAARQEGEDVQFNRDVRPILSDKCFYCHGPDPKHREAGLRLDVREEAIDYGAIVSDDWESSLVLERIESDDDDMRMPPPHAHKDLSSEERAMIRRWLSEGAVYQPHWSYTPLVRTQVPQQESQSADGAHPIDAFVNARIDAASVTPVARADAATLVRRLSFDLNGVPPSWEDVRDFSKHPSEAQWEKLVDTMLASPRYGERMATPWLDVARYADTVGYHGDQNQNVWAWRDWVVRAFNENKPFDQFTIEQLAGDQLKNPTIDQLVATCFNRLNMMTREGGAQPGEYLASYTADRVRTVGLAWLGSTMNCAECHDHKFDPIKTRDFYSMGAFFADIRQWGVYHDYEYTPNPDLRGFSNDHPFPPEIRVESEFLKSRIEQLRDESRRVVEAFEFDERTIREWAIGTREYLLENPDGWRVASTYWPGDPPWDDDLLDDGSVRINAKSPSRFELEASGPVVAVRIELLPAHSKGGSIRRDGGTDAFDLNPLIQVLRGEAKDPETVGIHVADANLKSPRYSNGFELTGIASGWRTATRLDQVHTCAVVFANPVELNPDERLIVDLRDNQLAGRVRISTTPVAPVGPEMPWSLDAKGLARRLTAWIDADGDEPPSAEIEIRTAFARSSGKATEILNVLHALDSEIIECRCGRTPVLVTESVNPFVSRVLPRGDWQNETGEVVLPATPGFLPSPPDTDGQHRLDRLDLARWLVSDQNPLTARVVVNRLWRQFLGEGLSPRTDDLGAQGAAPSHPELLDWLACEFRDSGWDVKLIVRLIVTSEVYRRSSATNENLLSADPENLLLTRQRPRRLPAEMVRDNALAIAGLLDTTMGGPPVKPYQPPGYYANLQFPDREYTPSPPRDQFRRGVYMHWQRTFLHPMLANFDAPSREDCVAMRNEANNPQQALTLLNDETFVEAAVALASLSLDEYPGDEAGPRIAMMFRRAVSREPSERELQSLVELGEKLKDVYAGDEDSARQLVATGVSGAGEHHDPRQLAVWTNIARVVLNLHETITRY